MQETNLISRLCVELYAYIHTAFYYYSLISQIFGWAQGYYLSAMNSQDPAMATASLDSRKRTSRRR